MTSSRDKPNARRNRPRPHRHRHSPPGTAPGTLLADPEAMGTGIRIVGFGPDEVETRALAGVEELVALRDRWPVLWVDVAGLGDIAALRRLGELFGLHALQLEDIVNVHQRAKTELYASNQFVVVRMPDSSQRFDSEQVAIALGAGWVITFQERAGESFEGLRSRLLHGGRARGLGADYLAYALLDSIIDAFFPLLERYGERVDELEEAVMLAPSAPHAAEIHALRRELLTLRRAIWPQREMLAALLRTDSPFITDATRVFLRDCYDHVIQAIDMLETLREITSGLLDIYLSSISARMNEVIRLLTVISTIFIPLTFIAGVYGMNFSNPDSIWAMPELRWYYGYPLVMGVMALVAGAMLVWFRRRRWV